MGRKSGGSKARSGVRPRRATWRASRGIEDEGGGEGVGLVAGFGRYGGGGR